MLQSLIQDTMKEKEAFFLELLTNKTLPPPPPPPLSTITTESYASVLADIIGRREYYHISSIKKKNGETRQIQEPKPYLKSIQHWLLQLLKMYKQPAWVFGLGGKEKSAVAHGIYHKDAKVIVSMDIRQFFQNTTPVKYRKALDHISLNLVVAGLHRLLKHIRNIVFMPGEKPGEAYVPTGAPTSPMIASYTFSPVDIRLLSLANNHSMLYSRYMDDLFFSGPEYPAGFQKQVNNIVKEHGYSLNHSKSKVMYKDNDQQIVTGVVLNNGVGVSKQYIRKLRARLDKFAQQWANSNYAIQDLHLQGSMNYVRMVNEEKHTKLIKYFEKRLQRHCEWRLLTSKKKEVEYNHSYVPETQKTYD